MYLLPFLSFLPSGIPLRPSTDTEDANELDEVRRKQPYETPKNKKIYKKIIVWKKKKKKNSKKMQEFKKLHFLQQESQLSKNPSCPENSNIHEKKKI